MFHINPGANRLWLRRLFAAAILAIVFSLVSGANAYFANNNQPPLRSPSRVAWTKEVIAMASHGDAFRGLLIAKRCNHCHGDEGFSASASTPNLAAMDRLVTWKQLDDFRSGHRTSRTMQPIAVSLSAQDSADVAAYYSMLPISPDPQDNRAFPQALPNTNPSHNQISLLLIKLGNGRRGIPPCQACHGPVAYVGGAPSLASQNATYILDQLEAFARGTRANDINMRMRSIASAMTEEERHAIAEFYGAGLAPPAAAKPLP